MVKAKKEDPSELPVQPKREGINPWQWVAFIVFSIITVSTLWFNWEIDAWVWLFYLGMAIVTVPNKHFHGWLVLKWNELLEMVKGLLALGAIILVIGVVIGLGWWFLSSVGKGLSSFGGYDGMSAKEWYYEYADEEYRYRIFRDCVETSANYYGFEDYDELQSQLDDVENCL